MDEQRRLLKIREKRNRYRQKGRKVQRHEIMNDLWEGIRNKMRRYRQRERERELQRNA